MQGLAYTDVRDAIETEYSEVERMVQSADFVEGTRALTEKRRPDWQGR